MFVVRLGRNYLNVPPRASVRRQPGVPVVLHPETGLAGKEEDLCPDQVNLVKPAVFVLLSL